MRVYLDNCCFNRPYDDQTQLVVRLEAEAKLFIQGEIADGRLELAWSYMMDYENACNPFENRRDEIADWRNLATEIVQLNESIRTRRKHYMTLDLKLKDATHLACAVEAGCAFFLTTDKGCLRKRFKIPEIQILNPVAFVCDPQG